MRQAVVAVEKLARIECAIDFHRLHGGWSGSQGSNQLIVLKLMLVKAYKRPNLVLTYPVNNMMLAGNWSRPGTVRAALTKLTEDGWLTVLKDPQGFKGKTYQLCVPREIARSAVFKAMLAPVSLSNQPGVLDLVERLAPLDAFANNFSQKDGKTALRIWIALWVSTHGNQIASVTGPEERHRKGSISTRQLASETAQPECTIERHLTRLVSEAVVVATSGGWQLIPGMSLEQLAKRRQTFGAGVLVETGVEERRNDQTERLRLRQQSAAARGRRL
jgi:hypothetical protein